MSFPSAGRFGAEAIISSLGVPVTSTPVTVYPHGSGTPASLYTDQTMGTATTNPISTDGLGNLTFYAAPGLYDLAFTVGGVATTQTVEVLPWWSDIAGLPFVSDFQLALGSVPSNPRWITKNRSFTGTPNGSGLLTVTYPTPFPNGCGHVTACAGDNSAGMNYVTVLASYNSLSSFTVECIGAAVSGGNNILITSGSVRVNYQVTGC